MKAILIIVLLILPTFSAKSQQKYVVYCDSTLLEASRDTAMAQVGTYEKTRRNDGEVEKYLTSVGLKAGLPYCAAGQYYCFSQAVKALEMMNQSIPISRTGVANKIFNDARAKGRKVKYTPNIHDMIFWKKKNSFAGHIERVIGIMKAGWVRTIGFNTSPGRNSSQRDGQGVFIRKRNIYHPLARMVIRGLIGFEIKTETNNDI